MKTSAPVALSRAAIFHPLVLIGLLVTLVVGLGIDRAFAFLDPGEDPSKEGVYGDWIRVDFGEFTQSADGSNQVTWSVDSVTGDNSAEFLTTTTTDFLFGLPQDDPNRTQATLRISQVGNGPPVGIYTITVKAVGATTSTRAVTFEVEPRDVFIEGSFTANGKVYDGDTTVDVFDTSGLSLSADDDISGVKAGDTVVLSPVLTFQNKSAGSQTIVLGDPSTPSVLTGTDAGNYRLDFTDAPTTTATITQKPLTLTGLSVSKTYDGEVSAPLTGTPTPNGVVGADTVTIAGSATWVFGDEAVGENKPLSITSGSYSLDGADAPNYTLTAPTLTGTITARTLTVSFTVADKEYDGTTTASVSVSGDDRVGDDVIDITPGAAAFDQVIPGENIAVTVDPPTLSGADASNYTAAVADGTTGTITRRVLILTGTFVAADKDYDGTTAPGVITPSLSLGRSDSSAVAVGTDEVLLDTVTYVFDSPEVSLTYDDNPVETHQVSITAFTLTGAQEGLYETSIENAPTARASIDPLQRQVMLTNTDKTYNGLTAATPTYSITTVNSDEVTVTGTANYVDGSDTPVKDVGSYDIAVNLDSLQLGGDSGKARNYRISGVAAATGEITRAQVTVTGLIGKDKVYDARVTAEVTPESHPQPLGIIGTEQAIVTLNSGSPTYVFDDATGGKNVGEDKHLQASGFFLETTDPTNAPVTNYELIQPSGADLVTLRATVTQRTLTPTITGGDMEYFRTRTTNTVTITVTPQNQLVDGAEVADDVSVAAGYLARYRDENVALDENRDPIAKPIDITGIALEGADAANYTISPTATTSGIITPRPVTLSNPRRAYNGAETGSVSFTTAGELSGESFAASVSATWVGKNVGSKTMTFNPANIVLSGADVNNYIVSNDTPGTMSGSIFRKELRVDTSAFAPSHKDYDGTKAATMSGTVQFASGYAPISGESDIVLVTPGTFEFATKDVGWPIVVSATTNFTITSNAETPSLTSNYSLTQPGWNREIRIRTLTLTGNFTADDQTYDADVTVDSIDLTPDGLDDLALVGVQNSEPISIGSVTAEFASDGDVARDGDGNVIDKTVNLTSVTLATGNASTAPISNYQISLATTPDASKQTTAAVLPKKLRAVPSADDKVYDGTDTATLTGFDLFTVDNDVSGLIPSDVGDVTIDLADVAATDRVFASKNVAAGITVTVTLDEADLSGDRAFNYELDNTTVTTTATITVRTLTLTGRFGAAGKTYDGTNTVTGVDLTPDGQTALGLIGVQNSEPISIGSVTAAFAVNGDVKRTGGEVTGQTVNLTGVILATGNAVTAPLSNYQVSLATTATASKRTTAVITPKPLTIDVQSASRPYDGTTNAGDTTTVSLDDPTEVVLKDRGNVGVAFTSATFNDPGVLAATTVSVTGIATTGTRGGNYSVPESEDVTSSITPYEFQVFTPTGVNRNYDTTDTASVTWSVDEFNDDDVSVVYTATFPSKNVVYNSDNPRTRQPIAQNISISVSGLTGTKASNYSVPLDEFDNAITSYTTTAVMSPIALRITGFTPENKVYDGTDDADFTVGTLSYEGILDNENVVFSSPEGIFDQADVGTAISVRLTTWSLSGTDANNYTVSIDRSRTSANITPKDLRVTLSATSRPYNGLPSATVTSAIVLDDVVAADRRNSDTEIDPAKLGVSATGDFLEGAEGSDPDGNAGLNKLVDATVVLSGTSSNNYTPVFDDPRADITRKIVRAVPTASNKTYDGTRTATITAIDLLEVDSGATGVVGDDDVSIDPATIAAGDRLFATKNALSQTVTVTLTQDDLDGLDATNYELDELEVTTTAEITKRAAEVGGTFTAEEKTYDQGTSAVVDSIAGLTLSNLVDSGISIDPSSVVVRFTSPAAGEGKTVELVSLTLQGTDAANYTVDISNVDDYLDGVINRLALTPEIDIEDRLWNGGTSATIDAIRLPGVLTGDDVEVNLAVALAQFQTSDQGENKPVNVTNIRLIGDEAGNYSLRLTVTAPGVYSATSTASITGTPLTVTITAEHKVYDGTRTAVVTVSDNSAVGDDIEVSYSPALFATPLVGNGITVTITNIEIGGDDAAKYVLSNVGSAASTSANITPKPIGITASNKVYDQTDAATIALDGVLPRDTDSVTFTRTGATFSDENVGDDKTVTATGLVLGGASAGNYSINGTETTTADITPRPLTLTFTPDPPVDSVASNITVTIGDNRLFPDTLTVTITDASTIRRGNQLVLVVTGVQLTCDGIADPCDNTNYTTTGPWERVLRIFASPTTDRPRPATNTTTTAETETEAVAPQVSTARPNTAGETQNPGPTEPSTPPAGGGENAVEGQTTAAPDILPGWRPATNPRATIDFGEGVTTRNVNPREIANQIVVKAPETIASEAFGGFAPGVPTQLEIMGARTFTRVTIPNSGQITVETLQGAFGQSALEDQPDTPRVFPAAASVGFATPTPEEVEILQDALAWLGLPDAIAGPGLAPGSAVGEVVWRVEGYRPGSTVFLIATSDPSLMAWGTADENGVAMLRGTVLDTALPPGDHRFRVVGTSVLGEVPADSTGASTIGDDLSTYLALFDDDTRVSVALWGDNAEGADHVAVRYIDPSLATPTVIWWWLLAPALLWLGVVLWRRRQGHWNEPGPTAGSIGVGAVLTAPAVIVGATMNQEVLIPWAIGIGIAVSLGLLVFRRRRNPFHRSSRQAQNPTSPLTA